MVVKGSHYAGNFMGIRIYLEKGEKLNWWYKVPIFFMLICRMEVGVRENEK